MEEKLVTPETAKLARDKGFDWHCDWRYVEDYGAAYHTKGQIINWKDYLVQKCIDYDKSYSYKAVERLEESYNDEFNNNDVGFYLSAPTQSLLQKYLRDVHRLNIEIESVWEDESREVANYCPWVLYRKEESHLEDELPTYFITYEEALESALLEALNLL